MVRNSAQKERLGLRGCSTYSLAQSIQGSLTMRRKTGNTEIRMLSTESFVGDHQDTLKTYVHKKGSAFLAAVISSLLSGRWFR